MKLPVREEGEVFGGGAGGVGGDDGFGTVGMRNVKQDLDTLGGSVKLLVRF